MDGLHENNNNHYQLLYYYNIIVCVQQPRRRRKRERAARTCALKVYNTSNILYTDGNRDSETVRACDSINILPLRRWFLIFNARHCETVMLFARLNTTRHRWAVSGSRRTRY